MHPKKHIPLIPLILKSKGISHAVISPGSRNAPLIRVFYKVFGNNCISIVDERSAAYFALGIAIQLKKPVAVITTSGTAVLNLAPALAEAFYLGVPLIAVTADRPPEWIDQEDNQAIRQTNVFKNIKKSYSLPVQMNTTEDFWFSERVINEAANTCLSGKQGPVHLNVPLREPLYDPLPEVKEFRCIGSVIDPSFSLSNQLENKFREAERILIVAGQLLKTYKLSPFIKQLLNDKRICIFAQAISNLPEIEGIINGDIALACNYDKAVELKPDLIIYFGGQVVSKRVKEYLRSFPCEQWLVDREGRHTDTFGNLYTVIESDAEQFLNSLISVKKEYTNTSYQQIWAELYKHALKKTIALANKAEYSDLAVFHFLSNKFTNDDIIFAGNSSVIRYFQLFPSKAGLTYANRGTSGIDGCLSTASGIAFSTEKDVYAILGDISFLYDSNGLWNNNLPPNLKIIVINNGGGGIFSMINGPQGLDTFNTFFKTGYNVNISKLCEAYHVKYYFCSTFNELEGTFPVFKIDKNTSLLEIKTPEEYSPIIFSNFINQLKS